MKEVKCCNLCGDKILGKGVKYCSKVCRMKALSNRNRTILVGDKFVTKSGYEVEVIEYVNTQKIKIRFTEPFLYEKFTAAKELKSGSVQTPYHRSVRSVGYFGEGNYSSLTSEYKIWTDMIVRCYTDVKGVAYQTATVCDEWHNYQTFAAWCNTQQFFGKDGYELDKDIIFRGNKIYCPSFCRFVPGEINRLIINRGNYRGKCLIGVHLNKNRYKRYTASVQIDDKRVVIGNFYSEKEAFMSYKKIKEDHIKEKATIFKDKMDEDIYQRLMVWEISEYD